MSNTKVVAASLSPADIRARAARIVAQVADQGRSLETLLVSDAENAQERGLTRSLVYGTVRWHVRLIEVLSRLSARPVQELDPELRALLLVGLYQLLHTDIAAHAAVAETVDAARSLGYPKAAGFVNAVLRRCQREGGDIAAELDRSPALRTAHPKWLATLFKQDWPEQFEAILDANNRHPPMWLRVNACRATAEEYLQRLNDAGIAAFLSDCAPQAIRLEAATDVRNLPGFVEGDVSVQDAAAQLAALLVAPLPGDRVLDACAAPGGKTCHLLELEPRIAELIAVDISSERLARVQENLDRLGLQAILLQGDAGDPNSWWDGELFDRILLDVPCSATGVIRRHPDIKLLRRATDIVDLARRQAVLLRRTWELLKPGGRLVYASCSALKAENAAVIAAFLKETRGARDITVQALGEQLPAACRLAPYAGPGHAIPAGEAQMDGFYYACLAKSAQSTGSATTPASERAIDPGADLATG